MAAARSVFRSSFSVHNATARLASGAKPSPSPFRFPTNKPLSNRLFRCPVELSVCVETMQPFHTATASALMTSMLSISQHSCCRLAKGSYENLAAENTLAVPVAGLESPKTEVLEQVEAILFLQGVAGFSKQRTVHVDDDDIAIDEGLDKSHLSELIEEGVMTSHHDIAGVLFKYMFWISSVSGPFLSLKDVPMAVDDESSKLSKSPWQSRPLDSISMELGIIFC